MVIVTFVGPRLQRGGPIGWFGETNHPVQSKVLEFIDNYVSKLDKNKHYILTSLQGGIEQWSIEAAVKYDIPFIVKLPHENPDAKLPDFAKAKFNNLLDRAHLVETLAKGDWSLDKIRTKEQIFMRESDIVVSFFVKDIKDFEHIKSTAEIIRPLKQISNNTEHSQIDGKPDDFYIPF